MLISVSGLDGAGKTTLIASLRQGLERSGQRVTVLHMNDHVGVYAWVRALRDLLTGRHPAQEEAPPRMDPLPTPLGRLRDAVLWSKTTRRLLYPLDLLFFLAIRFWVEVVRRRMLIMDRYLYDRLVDVAASGPAKWLQAFAALTPVPDVAVWLDIRPEQAFARKGEYTVPYLTRRAAAYERVFGLVPADAVLRLDTQQQTATRLAVADVVHDRMTGGGPRLALVVLRLLLDDAAPLPRPHDWSELPRVARSGGVLLRLAERLAVRGAAVPERFAEAVEAARVHSDRVLGVAQRLAAACTRLELPHAFLKVVERFPDTGRDLDLLVSPRSREIDRLMLRGIPALRRARDLPQRLSGSGSYLIDGVLVDVSHGRLGRLGEHARYARQLLARAQPQAAGDVPLHAPTVEDHFILLSLQQAYTRAAFRIADVYWAVTTLRDQQPDWDYLAFTAAALGLLPAVGSYLVYVDRIHARLFGRSLLPTHVLSRFGIRAPTRLRALLGRDAYRFPAPGVAGRVFVQQLRSTVRSGRWLSAARLCLLPMIALMTGLRKAA